MEINSKYLIPNNTGGYDLAPEVQEGIDMAMNYIKNIPIPNLGAIPNLPSEGHMGKDLYEYFKSNIMGRRYGDLSEEDYNYRAMNPSLMYDDPEYDRAEIPDLWHGSPHKFSKFSWDKLGTGEGAAAFGAGGGGYHTMKRGIAESYARPRNNLIASDYIGKEKHAKGIKRTIDTIYPGATVESLSEDQIFDVIRFGIKKKWIQSEHGQNLYRTTAFKGKDPSEYTLLDWYEPPTKEVLGKIVRQLDKEGIDLYRLKHWNDKNLNDYRGTNLGIVKDLYDEIGYAISGDKSLKQVGRMDAKQEASKFLKRAGIDGIRYPTETLSGKAKTGRTEFNYVIFDPNDVHIEEVISY